MYHSGVFQFLLSSIGSRASITSIATLLSCIMHMPCYGRWATPNDAAMEIENLTRHIEVQADGRYTSTTELQAKILKEAAKAQWAHFTIPYNADSHSIKILEAKTIINSQAYPVQATQIEDKPIASNVPGFDQKNQIILAYPHLETNATVFLKTQSYNKKPALNNFYADYFDFAALDYTKTQKVCIRSKLPLYIQVNDPDKVLKIQQYTQKKDSNTDYLLEIIQEKPYIKTIVNEYHPQKSPLRHHAFVSVSSVNNWHDLGNILAQDYEKIKMQALPPSYKAIAQAANTKKTVIEKINTVTALLSDQINYLTDLRTIQGRFVPQPLKQVANRRLGDCKDSSMATVAILNSIGIAAKVALVAQGEAVFPLPVPTYNLNAFSHAIVKVETPEGILWVDPTRPVSMASGLFPEISQRQALVLDKNHSTYEMIPAIQAKNQTFTKKETWDMSKSGLLQVQGSIHFGGNNAQSFTGAQRSVSDASLKHYFVTAFLGDQYGQITHYDMQLPNLHSRIVEDKSLHYTLSARQAELKTSAGTALALEFKHANAFLIKKDTVGDTYLGTPCIITHETTIKNIKPIGRTSLDAHLHSPWVDISRTVQYEKDKIIVHHTMELKKSWITAQEYESKEYAKLQAGITEHFNNGLAIIFEKNIS